MHNEDEFKASPRGSLRTVCDGVGVNVIEIGPAADEAVVSVIIDEAGIVRKIEVAPTDGGTEGHLTQSEGGGAHRNLPSLIAGRGAEGIDRGGSSLTPPMGSQGTSDVEAYVIYPAKHHVVGSGEMDHVLAAISAEMEERCFELGLEGRVLEAERLRQRTENDLLLLRAVGTCKVRMAGFVGVVRASMGCLHRRARWVLSFVYLALTRTSSLLTLNRPANNPPLVGISSGAG